MKHPIANSSHRSRQMLLAVVLFASTVAVGSGRAFAQDDGGFSIGDADLANAASTAAKIGGCWLGSTIDGSFGAGSLRFRIKQTAKGLKIAKGKSRFDYEWPGGAAAWGPMAGTVTGMAMGIQGFAGKGCLATIAGVVNQAGDAITGSYVFSGSACVGMGFTSGTLDVTPDATANCKHMR